MRLPALSRGWRLRQECKKLAWRCMSIPHSLLAKLSTNISKSEIDGFTLKFDEYRNESIPFMLKKMKDDNQVVRNNAVAVLSQIGDHRVFTQFMTFLEQELKWGSEPYLSRFVRSISRRDPETQHLMLVELEKYLEQNPLVPQFHEQKYKNFFTIIDNLRVIRNPYVLYILEKLISRRDHLLQRISKMVDFGPISCWEWIDGSQRRTMGNRRTFTSKTITSGRWQRTPKSG